MSGIDETEEEKKEQGKTNEVHNALEKIIKLDRKNSTFDFVDDLHKYVFSMSDFKGHQSFSSLTYIVVSK